MGPFFPDCLKNVQQIHVTLYKQLLIINYLTQSLVTFIKFYTSDELPDVIFLRMDWLYLAYKKYIQIEHLPTYTSRKKPIRKLAMNKLLNIKSSILSRKIGLLFYVTLTAMASLGLMGAATPNGPRMTVMTFEYQGDASAKTIKVYAEENTKTPLAVFYHVSPGEQLTIVAASAGLKYFRALTYFQINDHSRIKVPTYSDRVLLSYPHPNLRFVGCSDFQGNRFGTHQVETRGSQQAPTEQTGLILTLPN